MVWRRLLVCGAGLAACVGMLSAFQNFRKPWREYPAFEYNDFPIPPDYQEKTEWVFARLMYPNIAFSRGGFRRFRATSATGARADAERSGRWIIRGRTVISRWPCGG